LFGRTVAIWPRRCQGATDRRADPAWTLLRT